MKLRGLFGREDDARSEEDDDAGLEDAVDGPDEVDGSGTSDVTAGAGGSSGVSTGEGHDRSRGGTANTDGEGEDAVPVERGVVRGDTAGGSAEVLADEDGIDEDDVDQDDGDDEEELTGQVEFELSDWGSRERKLLDEELTALGVRKAWEAGTLVVAASDGDIVDDLIDEIEERTALDLGPDVTPVVYDVTDWPAGLEDRFIEALIEARIAHMRGYRELTVGVDDEEQVDTLVDEVTSAWEDEQDDDASGPDAQEVLSELFVSADRLLHDPSDRPATVRFDDASEAARAMAVPFGFVEADWTAITDRVEALADLLGETESSDDDITSAATDLRSHLRPLV